MALKYLILKRTKERDPRDKFSPRRIREEPEEIELSSSCGDGGVTVEWEDDAGRRFPVKHVVRHSPDGLDWGHEGFGSADLALSVLLGLLPAEEADDLYQSFKRQVVSKIPRDGEVVLVKQITSWAWKKRAERDAARAATTRLDAVGSV